MDIEGRHFDLPNDFSGIVPLYPLVDMVFFPKTLLPLRLNDSRYIALLEDALNGEELIGVLYTSQQSDGSVKLSTTGTIGRIASVTRESADIANVVLAGVDRFMVQGNPRTGYYLSARVKFVPDALPTPSDPIVLAQLSRLLELIRESKIFHVGEYQFPDNDRALLFQYHSLINAFCSVSTAALDLKQKWLESSSVSERYRLAIPALQSLIASASVLDFLGDKAPTLEKIILN